jgi:hypothetical protein
MNLSPGIYEATGNVNIRREPKIVEVKLGNRFITNRVGGISAGTQRMIYSLTTNKAGETWGRVSEADSAGVAEWICIQNINRVFMKPVDAPSPVIEVPSVGLEARMAALEARVAKLEGK